MSDGGVEGDLLELRVGYPYPAPIKGGILQFRDELVKLLNCHSMENGSDTPDFILAIYLINCLNAFDSAVKTRDEWHGFKSFHSHKLPDPER